MMSRRRFLTLSAAFACVPDLSVAASWQGRALGAEVAITLTGPRAQTAAALRAVPARLAQIDALFSLYRDDSALQRLNASGRMRNPDPQFRAVMAAADSAHALTQGLFDPTVQPLWHALAQGGDMAAARARIGWNRVAIADDITLGTGQALTLNGIAQGAATDLIRNDLRARGFTNALINIGEHAALGGPFRLGLQDPVFGVLGHRTLDNRAIATSSPGALRLGEHTHILAPNGATPKWSTLSIEADSATMADALSTAAVFMDLSALRRLKSAARLHRITAVSDQGDLTTL